MEKPCANSGLYANFRRTGESLKKKSSELGQLMPFDSGQILKLTPTLLCKPTSPYESKPFISIFNLRRCGA